MKNSRTLGLYFGVMAIAGCSPQHEQFLGGAITAAKVPLSSSNTLAQRISFEQRLSRESLAFLSLKPSIAPNFTCSTDNDSEVAKAEARILAFKAIEIHFKAIQDQLTDNFDANKYYSRIKEVRDAWEKIPFAPRAFSNHLALIDGVLKSASAVVDGAQRRLDYGLNIPRVAQEFHVKLLKIVADLKSSLISSDKKFGSDIIAWKTCEYERIRVIYSHENANPVDVANLFENMMTKMENYQKENKVIIGNVALFDKIVEANSFLANPKFDYKTILYLIN